MEKLMLVKPTDEYFDEICEYRQEWLDNDSHSHGDLHLYDTSDIALWIKNCRLYENRETLPDSQYVEHVECEQFMLVREGEKRVLGMVNFRHHLENPYLAKHWGNIGFGVRFCERGKGYSKAILKLCLEKCRDYGLDKILVTCDPDNAASRRTIISCGGQFEGIVQTGDEIDERYWINL
ncbi:MAG: GNAT family N-acetyltransferase [Defluviitaleaceae bacterium]|nr:GNAT family N-acetyltransferase [Defluviitaleaceae bacterium]